MSIYHLSVKTMSRSKGRTASGSAAYRAGEKIQDNEGVIHDYTKKKGILYKEIVLPYSVPYWASDRSVLWNEVDKSDTRKNSTVAREYEIALPAELSQDEQALLSKKLARYVVNEYGVAADISIHAPRKSSKDGQYENNNYHAHILTSTRALGANGFGAKTRILDSAKTGSIEIAKIRKAWEIMVNHALERNGIDERVSCESLEEQGIEREPQKHLGVRAAAMARKGIRTQRSDEYDEGQCKRETAMKRETQRIIPEPPKVGEIVYLDNGAPEQIVEMGDTGINLSRAVQREGMSYRVRHVMSIDEFERQFNANPKNLSAALRAEPLPSIGGPHIEQTLSVSAEPTPQKQSEKAKMEPSVTAAAASEVQRNAHESLSPIGWSYSKQTKPTEAKQLAELAARAKAKAQEILENEAKKILGNDVEIRYPVPGQSYFGKVIGQTLDSTHGADKTPGIVRGHDGFVLQLQNEKEQGKKVVMLSFKSGYTNEDVAKIEQNLKDGIITPMDVTAPKDKEKGKIKDVQRQTQVNTQNQSKGSQGR